MPAGEPRLGQDRGRASRWAGTERRAAARVCPQRGLHAPVRFTARLPLRQPVAWGIRGVGCCCSAAALTLPACRHAGRMASLPALRPFSPHAADAAAQGEVLSPPLGEAALKVCLAAAAAQGGLTAFVCSGGTCYVGQDR